MLQRKYVRSVLNKHKKRDTWFHTDYSVNPFEGCSCNCHYCYIRGSKYGENMEHGLTIKSNVLEVFEKQLAARAKKQQYGFIAVGSATDAYILHEEKEELTKGILEIILHYKFPVFISTKCLLIKRDIEIIRAIDKNAILPEDLKNSLNRGAILSVSISTMNEKVSSQLEPGAAKPAQRLQLVQELKQYGFLTGVNAIPLLPFISDTENEMEEIIEASKKNNADYILTGGLTLFGTDKADSKTLFYRFLEKYDRLLLPKYQSLYGDNFYTPFSYQQQLTERAVRLCSKHKISNSIIQ